MKRKHIPTFVALLTFVVLVVFYAYKAIFRAIDKFTSVMLMDIFKGTVKSKLDMIDENDIECSDLDPYTKCRVKSRFFSKLKR